MVKMLEVRNWKKQKKWNVLNKIVDNDASRNKG